MKFLKSIIKLLVVVFAIVGFGVMSVYIGVNFHLTNTKGIIDKQAEAFWENNKGDSKMISLIYSSTDIFFNAKNFCLLKTLKSNYPGDFRRILNLALNKNESLATKNLEVLVNSSGFEIGNNLINLKNSCDGSLYSPSLSRESFMELGDMVNNNSPFFWASGVEWSVFKIAVVKDKDVIGRVERETSIKGRILVSQLVAEQMRSFYSYRAWFEQALSPAKVLASMSQFSWGVLGIKQGTASQIENNLKDKNSSFYLGTSFEKMLDFQGDSTDSERYNRITNPDDHYYAYLYAALYNKQIINQWRNSGFDIYNRPEILATLYNIGFNHSVPSDNPQMGGSGLNINGATYSFGRLAYEFYYSGELLDEFPQ